MYKAARTMHELTVHALKAVVSGGVIGGCLGTISYMVNTVLYKQPEAVTYTSNRTGVRQQLALPTVLSDLKIHLLSLQHCKYINEPAYNQLCSLTKVISYTYMAFLQANHSNSTHLYSAQIAQVCASTMHVHKQIRAMCYSAADAQNLIVEEQVIKAGAGIESMLDAMLSEMRQAFAAT
jgi:hypothetical protein